MTQVKFIKKKKIKNADVTGAREKLEKIRLTKKSTPFRDVGGIVGGAVSRMLFGSNAGNGVGKWLGTGIGSIFGSGDYEMIGPSPTHNVLAGNIPKFSTTHSTNIVCHREYLGDIMGTAAFTNNAYPVNPGLATTFPWLSSVASSYQQYKMHGLIFEFRSLITDYVTSGAPGVIVMTTNYNSDDVIYPSRQAAENAEFAVSTKPTTNLVHMMECKSTETQTNILNVRTGNVPAGQDLRLYDHGNTQIITQNNPVQALGELWVSYCVEFFKPKLGFTSGAASSSTSRSLVTTTNPLGTIQLGVGGTLPITFISGTTIQYSGLVVGKHYIYTMLVTSGNTATTAFATLTSITGGTAINLLANGALSVIESTGTLASESSSTRTFTATSPVVTFTFQAATGTYPASSNIDIKLTALDDSVTPTSS